MSYNFVGQECGPSLAGHCGTDRSHLQGFGSWMGWCGGCVMPYWGWLEGRAFLGLSTRVSKSGFSRVAVTWLLSSGPGLSESVPDRNLKAFPDLASEGRQHHPCCMQFQVSPRTSPCSERECYTNA